MHAIVGHEIQSTETRYGTMFYYADDKFVGHALEAYGEYSEGEAELWRKIVQPGDTVIDVGANIGALTVAMSDIVGPDGHVLAFEPQPENFKLLNDNVRDKHNVRTFNHALGSRDGQIKVPSLAQIANRNYGAIELGSEGEFKASVHLLDNVVFSTRPVSLIKIDVEGMEAEVLQGAARLINKERPVLYVECDRAEREAELLKLIFSMDYFIFAHTPHIYGLDNWKKKVVADSNYISLNLLCIPAEKIADYGPATQGLRRIKDEHKRPISNKGWACVVRLGGIGDNLIAASPLKLLKRQGYKVEVISQEPQAVVFENNPYIDKLTVKSQRELPQNDPTAWQKYWWSRSCEYAKFVNLSHSVEVLMAHFQNSTSFWWPAEFRRKMCRHSYLEAAHDVVGVEHEFGPLFFPTHDEVNDIADFKHRNHLNDKPLIAWVVSGTRIDKLYPYSGLVIARLLSELDCNVIMLAAPSPARPDAAISESIMEHVKLTNSSTKGLYEARHVEGVHDWPIRRMLTLTRFCDLVIGPDTGPMWSVAMENVSKILLHSHASAGNITKHWVNTLSLHPDQRKVPCWPCHLLHDTNETCHEAQIQAGLRPSLEDKGAACISSISVDMLVTAAKGMLGNGDALGKLIDRYSANITVR